MESTLCVIIGALMIHFGGPGWAAADDMAAILIGTLMILVVGQGIWNASSELLDQMPPDEIVEQVRELATSFPGVSGVERLIGRKTGLQYILDSHLVVPSTMTVKEAHELGHQVKDRLKAEMPSINDIVVHVEPESDAKRV